VLVETERKLATALTERAAAIATADERRVRLSQLQTELDTSESVQRDFVKLSQSLQMKLELIRQNEKVCAAWNAGLTQYRRCAGSTRRRCSRATAARSSSRMGPP